jgi:predicted dehydrogenase/aryl-alcohol dehydrogenase-like predicted oxidoreductase
MRHMAEQKIRWGILGTGAIARTFARGLPASQTGRLVAVASRGQESADAFKHDFGIAHAHGSYDAILRNPDVDAVYVATPHPLHAEWAIRAARAGKHLMVEKPIGINHAEAMAIVEAAEANNVFLMEAFMYRCHPQTAKLLELIREGTIGELRMIAASFGFHVGFNPESRLFKNDMAGGGILDVGCYPVSMARLIAGAVIGKRYADPIEVRGSARLGTTGVDEWAAATMKFAGGVVAQVSTSISVTQENAVRIFGTEGQITILNPWVANRSGPDQGQILVARRNEPEHDIRIEADATSFTYEADFAGRAILSGAREAEAPAMSWEDSHGNMRALDAWRESIGLVYEIEKPAAHRKSTVAGDRLSRQPDATMQYARIAGIDKPVSRLIMGVDNQRTFAHSAILFDDFFERGGNAFDTAWIYGGGLQERLLGQWIKHRGVRDDVVVIAKGAHSPLCTPRDLTRQLLESLERLGTDHADIYLMHRDNTEVPVGEFVDVLNEHQRAGRFKVFGGSNWTLARIDEANAYASRNGRSGFSMISNNFSLARMVSPIWSGALSASDAESRQWFNRTQTPLLAWSSQARGFFLEGRAAPDRKEDEELVRGWYAHDNFQRLARVNELAAKKGIRPINLALAYVLNQPFPTFALIGPRSLSETRTSLPGLGVTLTERELRWLNLEE